MARKKTSKKKKKIVKRAGAKARRKKSVSKRPKADSRRTEKVRERRARLSRGLDATRAGIVAESEPERSLEAGQSGDLEGLSAVEDADSESVQDLAEEGQDYEAEIIEGVERAEDEPEKPMRVRRDEEPRPRPKRQTL